MRFLRVACFLLLPTVLLAATSDGAIARGELPLENWLPALWEPARAVSSASEGAVVAMALPALTAGCCWPAPRR